MVTNKLPNKSTLSPDEDLQYAVETLVPILELKSLFQQK